MEWLVYHSRFISALLHAYLPPRLKNICSSKPLASIAFLTPTSNKDFDGILAPDLQSRKRIWNEEKTENKSLLNTSVFFVWLTFLLFAHEQDKKGFEQIDIEQL